MFTAAAAETATDSSTNEETTAEIELSNIETALTIEANNQNTQGDSTTVLGIELPSSKTGVVHLR